MTILRYLRQATAGAMIAIALTAAAQPRITPRIDVGAQAGVTLSKINFNPSVPQTMTSGFMAGGSFRYIEERFFGILAEVNIEQRGWKEKYKPDEGGFAYKRQFTYIQVPVMTHIFFGSERVRGFFNAGPEIGFMIGKKTTANFDYTDVTAVEGYPMTNRETAQLNMDVKYRVDYGICAGLGVELQATPRNAFALEGRFYYGLHDVFANHKSDVFSASNGLSLQITLAYKYRLK